MKRRDFITLLGGATAAWPLAARAQQGDRVRWIGALVVTLDDDQYVQESAAAFEQSLARLGWTVGRNLSIDYRWGVYDQERAKAAAAYILRLPLDLIFVYGAPGLMAAQQATRTTPIVFTGVSEPVERGFVASMARPGGNTTGFANLEATLGGKFIELLKEMAPHLSRVAAMFNPASSFAEEFFRSAASAGGKLSVEVFAARVASAAEIDTAMAAAASSPGTGMIFPPDGFTPSYRRQIIELTARYRLPAIDRDRPFATEGGLASYGQNLPDAYRRAAGYVDRILRGEKPADLPVQNPTKLELVINLKAAKALGLAVPQTLLVAADEVIE
jgi:putative ABC transport system substrate-binding protein